jgi:phage terminase large subunit
MLTIETAKVFEPLLQPSRFKGAWGGRGGGKSHFFGELLVERCLLNPGTLAVTLSQSSKRLIETKIAELGVGQFAFYTTA